MALARCLSSAAAAERSLWLTDVAAGAGGAGDRDAHDGEAAQDAVAIVGLDEAALAIDLVVVERHQAVEGLDDGQADLVGEVARGDEHEVVAGDVADEVAGAADARDDLAHDVAGLQDHAVGLGVAVVVVERLQVVEVEVAEGEVAARRRGGDRSRPRSPASRAAASSVRRPARGRGARAPSRRARPARPSRRA